MKRLALIFGLLMVGLVIVAMSGGEATPDADFTFVAAREHNTLDPQRMSWSHDIRLANQLYERLVDYNFRTGEIEPAAAEDWRVSDDRRTYTFHIRENARWSNGDPVTARDYLVAWRRALTPGSAASYSKTLYPIQGAKAFFDWRTKQMSRFREIAARADDGDNGNEVDRSTGVAAARQTWRQAKRHFAKTVGISAPDKRTLKVTLAQPTPYFLELAAFATFSPNHAESVRKALTFNGETGMARVEPGYWTDPKRLVTNGPYRLAERRFKRYILLKANAHYWNRAIMKNDSVLERQVADPQNALLTYADGKADWLADLPSAEPMAGDLVRQHRSDVHTRTMAGTYFYTYNCRDELPDGSTNPLADPTVRRALSMAIDRKQITQRVTPLNPPIARTYIPPEALKDYQPPIEAGVTFDPERARRLLQQAGHANGQGLDGLTLTYNTGSGHARIAQAVQQMWQDHLGVNIRLEGVQLKTFSSRLQKGTFEIARASWFGDYPDPTTWLQKMAPDDLNNDGGWADPQFEQLLQKASTQTGDERMQTLRKAEALLLEKQPLALIYHYKNVYVYDPEKVTGLEPTGWSRWRFEQVSVE